MENDKLAKIEIQAHRGARAETPENTMTAFRRAIATGADSIELDLRSTSDGRIVLIHDTTVNRTSNGKGKVSQLTEEQIRALDFGSWFGPDFKGEKIPTIDELFTWAKAESVPLNLEIKAKDIEETVVKRVRDYGIGELITVSCFQMKILAKFREIAPEIKRAALIYHPFALKSIAEEIKPVAAHFCYAPWLTAGAVSRARTLGMFARAWTVNTPEALRRSIACGIVGVITDEVPLCRSMVDSMSGL